MNISDYSYELPEELIAKHPPKIRGASRLLVLDRKNQSLTDSKYSNLADFLSPNDLLILNDTRVIPSRMFATKKNGAKRELILLEKHGDEDYRTHKIMYRGGLAKNDKLFLNNKQNPEIIIDEILEDGIAIARSLPKDKTLLDLAMENGAVPLPPYLNRDASEEDKERYQTVFAKSSGSVAAPTASLNFTDETKKKLEDKNIKIAYLTLHVGLGTFLPIRTDKIENHEMHKEYFEISAETAKLIRETKKNGGKIIALGTTVARTLEYANDQIMERQDENITGEADIFMYPGYEFKILDGMLTNYHAPKSTVLMLAGAFAGWDFLMKAYEHSINEKYQFLSYGDSMLIL